MYPGVADIYTTGNVCVYDLYQRSGLPVTLLYLGDSNQYQPTQRLQHGGSAGVLSLKHLNRPPQNHS